MVNSLMSLKVQFILNLEFAEKSSTEEEDTEEEREKGRTITRGAQTKQKKEKVPDKGNSKDLGAPQGNLCTKCLGKS